MQVFAYTDEVVKRLNAYALSFPVQLSTTYDKVMPEVFVPPGMLPIKITQFCRYDSALRGPEHYHWAIFIPTSPLPGIGNYYELASASWPYYIKSTINSYNERRGMERGSHTVGFVLPETLPILEAHFALTPVHNLKRSWGCQNWVYDALKGLEHPHRFYIGTRFELLATQMAIVSEAWERGEVS